MRRILLSLLIRRKAVLLGHVQDDLFEQRSTPKNILFQNQIFRNDTFAISLKTILVETK